MKRRQHRGVKGGYAAELGLLADTFRLACGACPALEALLERVDEGPALFVASGGAFTVAQFAADLHQQYTGHLARAVTPLEFASLRRHPETAVVMFTASGRHPDAAMAVEAAKRALHRVVGIITLREEQHLPPALRGDRVDVVTVRSAVEKDGFLATNSVLAMSTALARARVGAKGLPEALPLDEPRDVLLAERALVLFPPRHAAVAYDLEARLHETGLASVELADYRNFAHGRHAGLARNLAATTVIALLTREERDVAERTVHLLPKATRLVRLRSELEWPASVLDLLAGTMRMIDATARAAKLNPARPGVALFGRRLYHLNVKPREQSRTALPVVRKLLSVGRAGLEETTKAKFELAFDEWRASVAAARFGGLVLDYDGTCCTTEGRFELPSSEVRTELLRILQSGVQLGFASGRGVSLHRDLRKWVPKKFWDRLVVGLYNGALVLSLDVDVGDQSRCEGALHTARARLEVAPFSSLISIESHTHQIEARVRSPREWNGNALAEAATEVFARGPALPVKVVASAHSVDVIASETTKNSVSGALRAQGGDEVLAIGDQGQVGGNDFELLAATPFTLSVDRCSADPTRCWNLARDGHRGPIVLLRYLTSLTVRGGRARFRLEPT